MLLQGLNQHLLESGDLLQISLDVTDVNAVEPVREERAIHIMRKIAFKMQICECKNNSTCLWGEVSEGMNQGDSAAPWNTHSLLPGCSAGPGRDIKTHTHMSQTFCVYFSSYFKSTKYKYVGL